MDSFANTSIVVAFIAGVAALFVPCCITVLLPSYLGSIFWEKYKIFLMTGIFFLGILTVFLPIGLGVSALAQIFNRYHSLIFSLGGLMLSLLGLGLILGVSWSIPMLTHPRLKVRGAMSVYILGLFAAIATTCCAPVLAGVMALSAASGSILWGGVYTLSYVLGMVAPLFLIALFLDKIDFTHKFTALRQPRSVDVLGWHWGFTVAELVAGFVFLGMGAYIIYLALANRLVVHSDYQLTINIWTAGMVAAVRRFTQAVPEIVWAGIVLIIFILLIAYLIKQLGRRHEK